MQFNLAFVTTALLSASTAMAATVTGFAGADCSGTKGESFNIGANTCFSLGGGSTKSIHYSGVPNSIKFYISGGGHDSCTHGAQMTRGSGSGCATAPAGVNWESVLIS